MMFHRVYFTRFLAVLFIIFVVPAYPKDENKIICSYAPSQSSLVASVSGAAGVNATAAAVATAMNLSAVVHSSGTLILTGTSGYIAGTLGAPAAAIAAAPIVLSVALVVGGTAVSIELVCAGENHPDQVKKINEAAVEFAQRFEYRMKNAKTSIEDMKKSISPTTERASIEAKRIAYDVWTYVYNKDADPKDM